MNETELTLRNAIKHVAPFAPIKIIFNDIVLYNDYDSEIEIDDGVYGENELPEAVIPKRLWQFDNYVVTSLAIDVVQYHHSIVTMRGEYRKE